MSQILQQALTASRIKLNEAVSSKKRALELISVLFAKDSEELGQDAILDALATREKIGSTALEKGIALPHCRVKSCLHPLSAIVTLEQGIDFDARDEQPVTLLWALIVPEEATQEHLNLLAEIAGILGDAEKVSLIKSATEPEQLYNTLFAVNPEIESSLVGHQAS